MSCPTIHQIFCSFLKLISALSFNDIVWQFISFVNYSLAKEALPSFQGSCMKLYHHPTVLLLTNDTVVSCDGINYIRCLIGIHLTCWHMTLSHFDTWCFTFDIWHFSILTFGICVSNLTPDIWHLTLDILHFHIWYLTLFHLTQLASDTKTFDVKCLRSWHMSSSLRS